MSVCECVCVCVCTCTKLHITYSSNIGRLGLLSRYMCRVYIVMTTGSASDSSITKMLILLLPRPTGEFAILKETEKSSEKLICTWSYVHTHTLSPFNFGVINVVTGQEDYCGLKLGPSQQLTPHSRTNKAVLSQNLEKGDSKDCSQTDQSTVCFQCVELLTCINYFVFLWNSLL